MYYNEPPRRKGSFLSYFIVALVAALIGGVLSPYVGNKFIYGKILPEPNIQAEKNEGSSSNVTITPKDEMSVGTAVAKKSMSAVVGITTVQIERDFLWEREVEGIGSGFVVHPDGYIMTNSHVVGDGQAKRINVLFENGDDHEAELLWNDPLMDLAMIKVDAKNLDTVELGDSDKLEVGETAVAIGNPLGLEFQRTLTSGVISGLNRSIKVDEYNVIENLIQTDASINPGNSGGPLLNAKGEVIGINTVKIRSQIGEGLGFAIPINDAKPIIDSIIKFGDFKTVQLGVTSMELEVYERRMGVELSMDHGVVVIEVAPNSPAAEAGLRALDVITKIDDKNIESNSQLRKYLHKFKQGDEVKVTIIRDGQELTKDVTLRYLR